MLVELFLLNLGLLDLLGLGLLLLFFSALTSSAPTSLSSAIENRAPTQIYYLVNCFDSENNGYAEIDYYPRKSKSQDKQVPNKSVIINSFDSINYEDGTVTAVGGFNFTAQIDEDAYTAKPGTKVGTAFSSTSIKPLTCLRLKRFTLYVTPTGSECQTDYGCQS